MRIERRFRRSMKQEMRQGSQRNYVWAILLVPFIYGVGLTQGYTPTQLLRPLGTLLVVVIAIYGLIKLGFAQIRAHAQPFDHSLIITEQSIIRLDNATKQRREFRWNEVDRIAISPQAFEFRFDASRQGETYLLDRSKLAKDEQRFIAEQLLAR